jgi:cell wall-associated NlpC family hydrolase
MDRRLTPFSGRVALKALKGLVEAEDYVEGTPHSIAATVCDLSATPGGPRERQLLLGWGVLQIDAAPGHAFVQSRRDGYVGWVADAALGDDTAPTHFVATPATHAYAAEDIKSPDLAALPFGVRLTVTDERRSFWETDQGFVPKSHLRAISRPFSDPVTVAQMHFGVPYLWGGNSTRGIDCSGLVQSALQACDIACPGDSDMQRADLGHPLGEDAALRRGDLIFWRGHVAMMVDDTTMIHANGHHMAVAYEPVAAATLRIAAQDGGPVLARKRL